MKDEIKEILDNINDKWEDYYVQDIVSGNDLKQLLDYITNLQEENERLKKCLREPRIKSTGVILDKIPVFDIPPQDRIDKAIEYINQHFHWGIDGNDNIDDLLNILQGKSDEGE